MHRVEGAHCTISCGYLQSEMGSFQTPALLAWHSQLRTTFCLGLTIPQPKGTRMQGHGARPLFWVLRLSWTIAGSMLTSAGYALPQGQVTNNTQTPAGSQGMLQMQPNATSSKPSRACGDCCKFRWSCQSQCCVCTSASEYDQSKSLRAVAT